MTRSNLFFESGLNSQAKPIRLLESQNLILLECLKKLEQKQEESDYYPKINLVIHNLPENVEIKPKDAVHRFMKEKMKVPAHMMDKTKIDVAHCLGHIGSRPHQMMAKLESLDRTISLMGYAKSYWSKNLHQ